MTLREHADELFEWCTGCKPSPAENVTDLWIKKFEQVRAEGENAGLEKAVAIAPEYANRIRAAKSPAPQDTKPVAPEKVSREINDRGPY